MLTRIASTLESQAVPVSMRSASADPSPRLAAQSGVGMDRIIEKKKWYRRPPVIGALAGLVLLAVAGSILLGAKRSRLYVQSSHLSISTVHRGPFQEFVAVQGEIVPILTTYLDAEEGGVVERVYVEAGQDVQQGQPILKLSNPALLMDVMYREAELFQQINNLRNTRLLLEQNRLSLDSQVAEITFLLAKQKARYERYEVLQREKVIPRQDYDDAKKDYELLESKKTLLLKSRDEDLRFREQQIAQLEGSIGHMQSNLGVAKAQLENLTLRAPLTGTLTSLKAEVGQSKILGERLGQIDAPSGFKVRAAIDEFFLQRVSKGYAGIAEIEGKPFQLRIARVFPEVKDGKFTVELEFPQEQPPALHRGQSIHVRLELSDMTQALLLARGGFFEKTGGNWVYVLQGDGKTAVKRTVRLGRQNPDAFEVLEGLAPGERVITSSYNDYGDNEQLVLR